MFDLLKGYLRKIEGKIAIRAGVVAGIALLFGEWFNEITHRQDIMLSGLYTVLSGMIVLQANLGSTYRAAITQFIGVLIGSIIGGLFADNFGASALSLGTGVMSAIFICSLLNLKENFRMVSVSVAAVIVSWSLHPATSPWLLSLYRFVDSCLGITIAMIVAHTFWPYHATIKLRSSMASACRKLNELFLVIIDPEFKIETVRTLEDELENAMDQNHQALEDAKLELGAKSLEYEEWSRSIRNLESMEETLTSLRKVYQSSTRKIFDDQLISQLEIVTHHINLGFVALGEMFENDRIERQTPKFNETLDELNQDLVRFRQTTITRNYELPVVESYFVSLYCLKRLLFLLQRVEKRISEINKISDSK